MLAFIHIHKTAGTTVQWILRSTYGLRHCEAQPWDPYSGHKEPWETFLLADDLRRSSRLYQPLESIGGHFIQPHSDLDDFSANIKYFAFVRHPVKHRASMFQHGVLVHDGNLHLEDWLREKQSSNRQTRMIAGTEDLDLAIQLIQDKRIFIGLTDRFDESMFLLKSLVADDLNIMYRPMRVTRDKSFARNLLASVRTREMLVEGNELDRQLYEFVKRDLYPSYQREFGSSLKDAVGEYKASLEPFKRRSVSVALLEKSFLHKLLLSFRLDPFDGRNVALSLMKTYLVHRPMIMAYRRGLRL